VIGFKKLVQQNAFHEHSHTVASTTVTLGTVGLGCSIPNVQAGSFGFTVRRPMVLVIDYQQT